MPKKLLLAEDSKVLQKVVQITFAHEDYEVHVVENGEACITRARELLPDVVLADARLAGMDGYSLVQALKAEPATASAKTVLLVGSFEPLDEARAAQVGADEHITKPFESQALIDKVNVLVTGQKGEAMPSPIPGMVAPRAPLAPGVGGMPAPSPVAPRPAPGAPRPQMPMEGPRPAAPGAMPGSAAAGPRPPMPLDPRGPSPGFGQRPPASPVPRTPPQPASPQARPGMPTGAPVGARPGQPLGSPGTRPPTPGAPRHPMPGAAPRPAVPGAVGTPAGAPRPASPGLGPRPAMPGAPRPAAPGAGPRPAVPGAGPRPAVPGAGPRPAVPVAAPRPTSPPSSSPVPASIGVGAGPVRPPAPGFAPRPAAIPAPGGAPTAAAPGSPRPESPTFADSRTSAPAPAEPARPVQASPPDVSESMSPGHVATSPRHAPAAATPGPAPGERPETRVSEPKAWPDSGEWDLSDFDDTLLEGAGVRKQVGAPAAPAPTPTPTSEPAFAAKAPFSLGDKPPREIEVGSYSEPTARTEPGIRESVEVELDFAAQSLADRVETREGPVPAISSSEMAVEKAAGVSEAPLLRESPLVVTEQKETTLELPRERPMDVLVEEMPLAVGAAGEASKAEETTTAALEGRAEAPEETSGYDPSDGLGLGAIEIDDAEPESVEMHEAGLEQREAEIDDDSVEMDVLDLGSLEDTGREDSHTAGETAGEPTPSLLGGPRESAHSEPSSAPQEEAGPLAPELGSVEIGFSISPEAERSGFDVDVVADEEPSGSLELVGETPASEPTAVAEEIAVEPEVIELEPSEVVSADLEATLPERVDLDDWPKASAEDVGAEASLPMESEGGHPDELQDQPQESGPTPSLTLSDTETGPPPLDRGEEEAIEVDSVEAEAQEIEVASTKSGESFTSASSPEPEAAISSVQAEQALESPPTAEPITGALLGESAEVNELASVDQEIVPERAADLSSASEDASSAADELDAIEVDANDGLEVAVAVSSEDDTVEPTEIGDTATSSEARGTTSVDDGESALRAALAGASREVIERIAWEVVPELAEAIIKEELQRLMQAREKGSA